MNDNAAARRAADRANQWEQTNNRRLLAAHMRLFVCGSDEPGSAAWIRLRT